MKFAPVSIFVLLAPGIAFAQPLPGDAVAGKVLAMRSCAGCHAVAQEQNQPASDGVPAFLTLARDPAVSERHLRTHLQTPHARMPSVPLSRREIEDVISYILSMRLAN